MIWLLFQEVDTVRKVLNWADPKAGLPLPERTYAEDCRVLTSERLDAPYHNIQEALDFYLIAHVLGWFGKMLIIRDVRLSWIIGLLFELL